MGAFVIAILLSFTVSNNEISNINNLFIALTKDIAVALIGFLGFTVAGLAILTGVISNKVVHKIYKTNKNDNLEKILLSFYFLGLTTGIAIICLFALYIISVSSQPFNNSVVIAIGFAISYLVIFIIFYAIKLIGNCLEIFFIVNETDLVDKEESTTVELKDLKNIYNSYRLTALEYVCLKKMKEQDLKDYMKIISDQIEGNDELKSELEKMYETHFKKCHK